MAITWRPATCIDIDPGLRIQLKNRGDALVGSEAAVESWKRLFRDPFSSMSVLESSPTIRGHCLVGFGAAVIVSSSFANAAIVNPRPDINSRVIACIHSGQPVIATRSEVARANAEEGIDIVVLYGVWRDDILNPAERQEAKTLLASSFTEQYAGYRIRKILCETVDDLGREFLERSIVYKAVAEFPELGRVLYVMTRESVKAVPGSLGNVLFNFREPMLRLRDSDQQMLLAALRGVTDSELATELGLTLSAVKARWRSTYTRIAAVMPGLVSDAGDNECRGSQKRHIVLAYIRSHPEELRPYNWKAKIVISQVAANAAIGRSRPAI